jgi:hypothetical protein
MLHCTQAWWWCVHLIVYLPDCFVGDQMSNTLLSLPSIMPVVTMTHPCLTVLSPHHPVWLWLLLAGGCRHAGGYICGG